MNVGRSHMFFWRHMWLLFCHRDEACFLRGRPWSLLNVLIIHKKGSYPVTVSFNPRLPSSVDPGAIYPSYPFWVSPTGPRRRLHTLLPFSQLSLPDPPHSSWNCRKSTSIFSHNKCPTANTSRFRPCAGVVLQVLLKCCSLPATVNSSKRRILLDASFERRTWNKMSANKACTKDFDMLRFFWTGEGLDFCLFVCLWFLFYAYLWNYNNCNQCVEIVLN